MCSAILWCFPPYLPGFIEAGLHCIYSGFFIIEAATYGLHLEQKFHGVLQILLINFYVVLLCILFIRWHVSRHSFGCHLFTSLSSCTLTVFIGQMILMYLDHMEKSTSNGQISMGVVTSSGGGGGGDGLDGNNSRIHDPLKMDLIVLILDVFVYLLITCSYIFLLIRISCQVHKATRVSDRQDIYEGSNNDTDTMDSIYDSSDYHPTRF